VIGHQRQTVARLASPIVHSCAVGIVAVFDLAAGLGLERALQPAVEWTKAQGLPDWLIHWGHPGNMAVVLLAMGGYGSAFLGWQIRTRSGGAAALAKARDMHPKLSLAMTAFFTIGATGGITSLMVQGKAPFQSTHVWTGILGLLLLYTQASLPLFFDDDPSARGIHAFLGSGVLLLFVIHMGLGIQLGLSL
jgi:Protein of unknown function (DUF4079)